MKTLVGFAFTDSTVHQLSQVGFKWQQWDRLDQGYIQYLIPLSADQGLGCSLEVRQISDEELYFSQQAAKKLDPFVAETNQTLSPQEHSNGAIASLALLDQNMEEGSLKLFLKIRKAHSLWAVVVRCQNFSQVEKYLKKEQIYQWNNKKSGLLHLGTACYDILFIE